MRAAQKITIVTTGEPIPSMLKRRGSFATMIREAVGDAWSGGYDAFDARLGPFPHPAGAYAFIITGSPANVPNREPWMLRAEAWLREVVRAGTPTFGICFGHQILAQALGGETIKNPRGREIGTVRVERRADDLLFDGIPEGFLANVTHVDTVGRLPEGAASLARSDRDDHHAIRFGRACYGVQYHPEIDREIMLGYIESRREILASEGFDVDALAGGVIEAELARRTLQNFVRHVVLRRATDAPVSERALAG